MDASPLKRWYYIEGVSMGFRFDIGGMEPSWSDATGVDHYTGLLDKGSPAEDVGAFLYYATNPVALLSDPKAPWEIRYIQQSSGVGFAVAVARWLPVTMLIAGTFGWALDPKDRREGGLWERPSSPSSDSYWDRGSDDPWTTW